MQNTQKTQLERTNEQLMELASGVTTLDREAAFENYSEFTVVQYLKGRGRNLDTAVDLLQFFRKRIERRDRVIEEGK